MEPKKRGLARYAEERASLGVRLGVGLGGLVIAFFSGLISFALLWDARSGVVIACGALFAGLALVGLDFAFRSVFPKPTARLFDGRLGLVRALLGAAVCAALLGFVALGWLSGRASFDLGGQTAMLGWLPAGVVFFLHKAVKNVRGRR